MKPGLTRTDDAPYPGAYLRPVPRLNGGGGLVSSAGFGGVNSKPPSRWFNLAQGGYDCADDDQPIARVGELHDKGFGLTGSLILEPSPRWWISPRANVAGLMMTQRQMAFGHPFAFEFKRLAYEAVKHKKRSFENTMHESAIGTLFAFIGAKRKTYARIELFRF